MAILTVQKMQLASAGTEVVFNALDVAGDSFLNDSSSVMMLVDNTSGGAIDVTISTVETVPTLNLTVADWVISCPDGKVTHIGPFDTEVFNVKTQGETLNHVEFSAATQTGITVALVRG